MTATATARVFVVGISGSGKTTGASANYIANAPRVLIVDQIGEWEGKVTTTVNTLPELYRAIHGARQNKKWRISYTNADNRLNDCLHWLIPLPNVNRSPVVAMRGMVLVLDEIDLIAPAGGAPEVIRNLYRRSRHVGLSIVSITQRPANVLREVSAQSTQVLAYRLTEPRDRDYLANLLRLTPEQLDYYVRWTRIYRHGALWRDLVSGRTLWIDDAGKKYSLPPTLPKPRQPTERPERITEVSDVQPLSDSTAPKLIDDSQIEEEET